MARRWRRTWVLAVVVAVAGAAPAAGEEYVALGDSYSSGTGTRTYYDQVCQRSTFAYPALVDVQRPNTELVLAACAGAQTRDVLDRQVASLTGATRWVTITIGGNDAGFSSVITECAQPDFISDCNGAIDRAQAFIRTTLPGRLDAVYAAIRARAPGATIMVLSYPRAFMGRDCNAGTFFSTDEMRRLNETADLLRDVTRDHAVAAGATFLDAIPPFVGHAVCARDAWLNGLSAPLGESYHPNRAGHSAGYAPLVRGVMG